MPGQLIIQYTDRCNATCPQCEMRKQNDYERSSLDVDTGRRLIDAAAAKGVEALSFTGGEPFMAKDDVLQLIRHAGEAGIKYIRTGTNGFMFMGVDTPKWESRVRGLVEALAATKLYTFWISIDSVDPAVHEEMRGLPGVLRGIEKALPIFHEHGIYPSANLGINRNAGGDYRRLLPDVPPSEFNPREFYDYFRGAFARFYQRVADLGFSIVNMCYPMSVEPAADGKRLAVYSATSPDRIVRFRREEKVQLFQALFDTVPQFRSKVRIFTPLTSVLSILRHYRGEEGRHTYGCRGGVDFFFVNSASGDAFPCGYRGTDNMGKYWDLDVQALDKNASCTQCDWECFRDPSEMIGPFAELTSRPLTVMGRLLRDAAWRRLWTRDLRYYRACDYFCGRKPMRPERLARFEAETEPQGSQPAAGAKPQLAGAV
jgi:MoaA/NifB/PqqE/SkfB family radical SAM enzyme